MLDFGGVPFPNLLIPSNSETIRYRWYQAGCKYWWVSRVWRLDETGQIYNPEFKKTPGDSEGSCSPCVLAALTSGFAGIRRDCSDFVGEGEIGQVSPNPPEKGISPNCGGFSKPLKIPKMSFRFRNF